MVIGQANFQLLKLDMLKRNKLEDQWKLYGTWAEQRGNKKIKLYSVWQI